MAAHPQGMGRELGWKSARLKSGRFRVQLPGGRMEGDSTDQSPGPVRVASSAGLRVYDSIRVPRTRKAVGGPLHL